MTEIVNSKVNYVLTLITEIDDGDKSVENEPSRAARVCRAIKLIIIRICRVRAIITGLGVTRKREASR
jgi:hypothetical protein